jgi:hypothetical protein
LSLITRELNPLAFFFIFLHVLSSLEVKHLKRIDNMWHLPNTKSLIFLKISNIHSFADRGSMSAHRIHARRCRVDRFRVWRDTTDSLASAATSGERRCRTTDSPGTATTGGARWHDGIGPASASQRREEEEVVLSV